MLDARCWLAEQVRPRVADDPCPYLLAICQPSGAGEVAEETPALDESGRLIRGGGHQQCGCEATVRGTLLVSAERGREVGRLGGREVGRW